MSASSSSRVEPEAPSFPASVTPASKPEASAQPAGDAAAPSADQLARLEDKLARIEEKLARSEAQVLRMEDRIEHNTGVTGVLASQESVDRVYSRLRMLPGFPSLIVAAILAGVIAAALIALVQRFGLTG
ncbi:hypothetical protein GCM10019059_19250 [Camelimonas fluminis]|uniref:DUF3618 domain-containing protein n=1 Tax=Camelimonas fluminis TaxID=1576911 RepID=A0ABV7UJU5_9HYPH|nr:hypothetical protein [Camelimonas fluminis]GHE59960.1 hypothetical protein GCM10019059_19250 [Camelimonas fluminis]